MLWVVLVGFVGAMLFYSYLSFVEDGRTRARMATFEFLTEGQRRFFEGPATLDRANHVMASAHRVRLEQFAAWLKVHASHTGALWTMVGPDGDELTVEMYAPEDFQWSIPPSRNWRWARRQEGPSLRLWWEWDLEGCRVTAQSRGFRHREQWVFQPTIDPERQALTLR
ncbi:MAG TPA: hypothetical protein VGR26_11195 [Acidimicrobiales bacterium]|nr:hypothetical protein [Acidimicrobiales bacterium]